MTAGTFLPSRSDAPAGGDREGMVVVGRVARAHGRRGEVVVDAYTDFPELRFRCGGRLFAVVEGRFVEFRVGEVRFQRGRPIVGFEGVSDIDGAERLAGVELRVRESELAPLPPDTYYEHDLMGCRVETVDGRCVGAVHGVETACGTARLIVDAAGVEVDVPLVDAICVRVEPAARMIVVDPPAGLLDLNRRPPRRRNRPAARGAAGS